MGTEPEQENRERAVTLANVVEIATENGLSAGGEARLREILHLHWRGFRGGLRGDSPARFEPLTVMFKT